MPPYPSRSTCPPQRTQISDGNRESGRKLSSDYDDDVRVRSSVHHSSANLYAILLSLNLRIIGQKANYAERRYSVAEDGETRRAEYKDDFQSMAMMTVWGRGYADKWVNGCSTRSMMTAES